MYYLTDFYPYNQYPMYNYQHYPVYYSHRQYPQVDISVFEHSVTAFQKIANESIDILEKFTDREFTRRLMRAAQEGNQKEVDRLIKSIGTSTPITTEYNPSGVLLTIHAEAQGTQCCTLTMFLKWGR